jgi:hypothetical protein
MAGACEDRRDKAQRRAKRNRNGAIARFQDYFDLGQQIRGIRHEFELH